MCQRIHDICRVCKSPKYRNFNKCTETYAAIAAKKPDAAEHKITNIYTKREVLCSQCWAEEREDIQPMVDAMDKNCLLGGAGTQVVDQKPAAADKEIGQDDAN